MKGVRRVELAVPHFPLSLYLYGLMLVRLLAGSSVAALALTAAGRIVSISVFRRN